MGGAAASKQSLSEFEQAVENISHTQDNRIHAFVETTTTPPASPLPSAPGHALLRFSDDEGDGGSSLEESHESLEVTSLVDESEMPPSLDAPRISPVSTPRAAVHPSFSPTENALPFEPFVHSLKPTSSSIGSVGRPSSGGLRPLSAGFVHKPTMGGVSPAKAAAVSLTPRSRPQSAREMMQAASSSSDQTSSIGVSAEEALEAYSELRQHQQSSHTSPKQERRNPSPPSQTTSGSLLLPSTQGAHGDSGVAAAQNNLLTTHPQPLGRLQLGSRNGSRKGDAPSQDNYSPMTRFGSRQLGHANNDQSGLMPLPRGGFPAAASATAVVHPTLHRADSFTDEFKYDTTVVLAMRQQRVQAALENMQLEREVEELRSQLNTFEHYQPPPSEAAAVPTRHDQQSQHHRNVNSLPPSSSSHLPSSSSSGHQTTQQHQHQHQQHNGHYRTDDSQAAAAQQQQQQRDVPISSSLRKPSLYPSISSNHRGSEWQHQSQRDTATTTRPRDVDDSAYGSDSESSTNSTTASQRSGAGHRQQQQQQSFGTNRPSPLNMRPNGGGESPRQTRRRQRRRQHGRQQAGTEGVGAQEATENTTAAGNRGVADAGDRANLWSRSMEVRSNEVEFMLRRPVSSNEDIQYTLAAAEAGLLFMDQMETTSRSLGVLVGQLSRWILPFGNSNQSVADQKSRAREAMENIPPELRGRVTDKEIAYLVRGANSVRKLIRVKIADDNDLLLAKDSLTMTARFFRRLCDMATDLEIEPSEVLRRRRMEAASAAANGGGSCSGEGYQRHHFHHKQQQSTGGAARGRHHRHRNGGGSSSSNHGR